MLGRYESSLVMRQLKTSGEKVQGTPVQPPLVTTLGALGLVEPAFARLFPRGRPCTDPHNRQTCHSDL